MQLFHNEFLFENLNEGLIRSYSIADVKHVLEKEFPCISNISVLDYNPYLTNNKKSSHEEFIAISMKSDSFFKYEHVIEKCHNLFGWFTGVVDVEIKEHNRRLKTYNFFRGEPYRTKYMHDYANCFFSDDCNEELKEFMVHNQFRLFSVTLMIEEKFPIHEYVYSKSMKFYHKTDIRHLEKILRDGLVPKSKYNYPSRIYLSNDISDFDNMMFDVKQYVILEIALRHNQKLYYDPQSNGFFTYDNISPNEISIIEQS